MWSFVSTSGVCGEANPRAAIAIYWIELDRQVRISGPVEKTSRAESETYFHSRPRGSQQFAIDSKIGSIRDRNCHEIVE